jgi:D-alanyl-lipoteichoic acid acyltransferase DltB (MBOAT superfamily)
LSSPVDLYSVRFWLFVAVAVAVLNSLLHRSTRKWALALLNLGFLGLYIGGKNTALIAAGLLVLRVFLRLVRPGRPGAPWLVVGGLGTLGLFVFHKRPDLFAAHMPVRERLEYLLVVIGFSYVALRLYELARAVHEGRHAPPGFASTVNYLLPFHMLAAGPIQSYDEFVTQSAVPAPLKAVEALDGFDRIAAGLFKKFVLANLIQRLFMTDYRSAGPYVLLEAQLTFIWLYLDFSAYSDVAVGVGRLMGVATPENFNRPYLARNTIEFWERWHISLSQFIRRNIFIPVQLGLMRWTDGQRPLLVASLAFTVSFLLCGLWHQISLRYLAWGAFYAAGLVVCNLYRYWLTKWLGRKGVNRYMANRWIRLASTVLTFEFSVVAIFIITYPFEVPTWIPGQSN